MNRPLTDTSDGRCRLGSPTAMPRAAAFLWNKRMMMQVNCRGYVVAQHMQPEPGKYAHGPFMEARSFMQPEQPYYAHHPGRFVYIKDEETGELFSAPYEPVCKTARDYVFDAGSSDIRWKLEDLEIEITLTVSLPMDHAVELWSLSVRNNSGRARKLSVYPFFTIGYMSWMNQSASYRPDLGGIVASCVTPYQKVEDAAAIASLKDKTFLLHDTTPDAWEAGREAFEGEGGLRFPGAIADEQLANGDAIHETPAAVLQYRVALTDGDERDFRFIFGPALDDAEIETLRDKYLPANGFEKAGAAYREYLEKGRGCLEIETPDSGLNEFVNHWLGRQVFYHGSVNRLTTDPQTRNYLQDNMGMVYFSPGLARQALLTALGQQKSDGAMPDGILLHQEAELKYINQVPHADHCVWLPVFLQAYLDETGDFAVLEQAVTGDVDGKVSHVFERVTSAMRWLVQNRDERGLSYIAQGDWCDPMNMVGHKGKGVSGWLSVATAYALRQWADISRQAGRADIAQEMDDCAGEIDTAVQEYLWNGNWFARGITDDGAIFGTDFDDEGKIFLNPQSWAILASTASNDQRKKICAAVEQHLETPFGVEMLGPPFTRMRTDIGRVTQKHPGTAENGSVYNHAAIFYIHALYMVGEQDRAFDLLRRMIPGPGDDDYLQRGQLPVFIPNYYRGAYRQLPRTAGRSSQLFNTGTVAWFYRIVVEDLFGLRGCPDGLLLRPRLPAAWQTASVVRHFRGAKFKVRYRRKPQQDSVQISVSGKVLEGCVIKSFSVGQVLDVDVTLGDDSP